MLYGSAPQPFFLATDQSNVRQYVQGPTIKM